VNFAAANEIAAHGPLDFSVIANGPIAVQIAFVSDDQATASPDRPAIVAGDPVVLHVDVGPAQRTDRRGRTLRDLPFTNTFEASSYNRPVGT